jgi:hypothetical protein
MNDAATLAGFGFEDGYTLIGYHDPNVNRRKDRLLDAGRSRRLLASPAVTWISESPTGFPIAAATEPSRMRLGGGGGRCPAESATS